MPGKPNPSRPSPKRLSSRLFIYVVVGSAIISVITTVVKVRRAYLAEIEAVKDNLRFLEKSYIPQVNDSLFKLDWEQLQLQLEGMVRLPGIEHLYIRDVSGPDLVVGNNNRTHDLIKKYHLFNMGHPGKKKIGVLVVTASFDAARNRVVSLALFELFLTGLQIALVAAMVLVMIQIMVTRHLQKMAAYAQHLDMNNLESVLQLDRRDIGDELSILVRAIEDMRCRLKEDIELRKVAEKEAANSRKYIDNITNSMPSMLIGIDERGCIVHWNRQAIEATGISVEFAKGQPLTELLPIFKNYQHHLAELSAHDEVAIERKVPFRWKDETGTVDIAFYPLSTAGHRGIVIRVDNITERIRIEEMMIQSEKMLSVGGLAAGMAHEINNPLGGITQSMQVVRNRLKPDNPANVTFAVDLGVSMVDIHRYLEKRSINKLFDSIQDAGQRAATIVRNMLSFSRKSDFSFQPININELLEKTVALAAHDFDLTKQYDFRKIEYLRQYDPALPLIPCQEGEIQQVLLNILKNGAEAMAMINPPRDTPRFILRTTSDHQYVHIDIEDNGPGMSESISTRIFEPFFTTKPPGSGTGLGLSVSYFIITENHNGQMSVSSAIGKGTGFRISLPLAPTV